MKNVQFILIIWILILFSVTNLRAQDKIRWQSESQLNWTDFQAKARMNSPMAAETQTKTDLSIAFQDGEFDWKVDCYFSPDKSWVNPNKKSENLLKHEHLHFDIAELHARKIRKNISELKLVKIDDAKKIQKAFEEGLKELQATQKQYDKDTDHGLIEDEQSKWNKKIATELKRYNAFASSKYKFDQ